MALVTMYATYFLETGIVITLILSANAMCTYVWDKSDIKEYNVTNLV